MSVVAILGKGGDTVPETVIIDGLKDLLDLGDSVVLPWYGPPSKNLATVYDYVQDEGITYKLFYTDRPPPPVFDGTVIGTDDLEASMAVELPTGSKLAILFPDDDSDLSQQIFGVLDRTKEVDAVDLTNGLVPITIHDDGEDDVNEIAEAEELEHAADESDSLDGFTREELQGLSLKILKRAAEPKTGETIVDKEHAIAVILGEVWPPEAAVQLPTIDVAELQQLVATLTELTAKLNATVGGAS